MHALFCIGWMSNLLVNAFRNFYYWDSSQSLLIVINIYHPLLLIWNIMVDYNLLLHVVVYAVLLALGWYVVNLSSVVQLLSFYEPISITGEWELYTIIINLKLSLSPYTDTQMLKKGESDFLMYLQRLFSSVHWAYWNPQTNKNLSRYLYILKWLELFSHL